MATMTTFVKKQGPKRLSSTYRICGHSRANSTVSKGTAFEKRSLKLLQDRFSMTLKRVGGREDGGIDLLGWWWLPPLHNDRDAHKAKPGSTPLGSRTRIRVLGQCKAEKKKLGPNYVRELEGVSYRFMATPQPELPPVEDLGIEPPFVSNFDHSGRISTIALLVSESPFTKSTILRAQSSSIPFFLLHLPQAAEPGDQQDQIGAALWNPALGGAKGLLKGHMEVRWEMDMTASLGRPGLWWQGKRLPSWIPSGFDNVELSG